MQFINLFRGLLGFISTFTVLIILFLNLEVLISNIGKTNPLLNPAQTKSKLIFYHFFIIHHIEGLLI